MCDPFSLIIAASSVATGVGAIKSAKTAAKARAEAARQAKESAAATKLAADTEARQERRSEYDTRRTASPRNPQVAPGSLFAARSFFSPV